MRRYRMALYVAVWYVILAAIAYHFPDSWPALWSVAARLAVAGWLVAVFHLYSWWAEHRYGAPLKDRRLFLAAAMDFLAAALHPRPADALRRGAVATAFRNAAARR